MSVQDFHNRADEAEKLIEILNKRVASLEQTLAGKSTGGDADSKVQLLEQLRSLRITLSEDKRAADQAYTSSKKLSEENKALKTENSKLKYRVEFLMRALEESEGKGTWGVKTQQAGETGTLEYRLFFNNRGVPISPFHDIPLWVNRSKGVVNMIVEIPKGTQPKLEISREEQWNPIKQDVKNGKLRNVALPYPFNYGALPQTWENPGTVHPDTNAKGDNDPLDAVELSGSVGHTGDIRRVKILGTYAMIDEGETDWKIVCIDINDPLADQINDASDIERAMPGKLKKVFEFLRDYKKPDGKPENTFAYNGQLKNKEFAVRIVEEGEAEWKKLVSGKTDSKITIANTSQAGTPGYIAPEAAKGQK